MKTLLLLLLSTVCANATCSITFTMTTQSPAQTLTKTYTDTDAHCVLAIQALQDLLPGNPTPAQAALVWTQNAINNLISITRQYQLKQSTPAPIDPQ